MKLTMSLAAERPQQLRCASQPRHVGCPASPGMRAALAWKVKSSAFPCCLCVAEQAARANAITQAAGMGDRVSFQVGGEGRGGQWVGVCLHGVGAGGLLL